MLTLEAEIQCAPNFESGPPSPRLTILTACSIDPHGVAQTARRHRTRSLPADAEFVLSALEAGHYTGVDRRATQRRVTRAVAELQLFSDRPDDAPWTIYTRDATTRSIGFVSRRRLPLGYGGRLHLHGPNGEELAIACTVRRCYEAVNTWYEGSLSFNREQWAFDIQNTSDAD